MPLPGMDINNVGICDITWDDSQTKAVLAPATALRLRYALSSTDRDIIGQSRRQVGRHYEFRARR
eukprot:1916276-Rhodomonas_salina.4